MVEYIHQGISFDSCCVVTNDNDEEDVAIVFHSDKEAIDFCKKSGHHSWQYGRISNSPFQGGAGEEEQLEGDVKYFTLVRGTEYTDKNQLHTALKSLALSFSNQILANEDELEAFIENLHEGVNEVHGEYPRCKEIPLEQSEARYHSHDKTELETVFICRGVFQMMIYKEKSMSNA